MKTLVRPTLILTRAVVVVFWLLCSGWISECDKVVFALFLFSWFFELDVHFLLFLLIFSISFLHSSQGEFLSKEIIFITSRSWSKCLFGDKMLFIMFSQDCLMRWTKHLERMHFLISVLNYSLLLLPNEVNFDMIALFFASEKHLVKLRLFYKVVVLLCCYF